MYSVRKGIFHSGVPYAKLAVLEGKQEHPMTSSIFKGLVLRFFVLKK